MLGVPPLIPKIDAVFILDGDGNRLAAKYYAYDLTGKTADGGGGDNTEAVAGAAGVQAALEQSVHLKAVDPRTGPSGAPGTGWTDDGITPAAGIADVGGSRTAVFCPGAAGAAGGDARVVVVGPSGESEPVLAHLAEGLYAALHSLLRGAMDRHMVLDNLELVVLLIDELCDGGIMLEVDTSKLVSSVLLREDDGTPDPVAQQAKTPGPSIAEMTIGQAFKQARDQFVSQLASRDGM
eukprot:CAMPEP_0194278964 /NCGR_PEP_ID=MMETSP0169-20130528/12860_1 /TAXON_ID=218684 /ORGANISM="Corethron pennatum, Strain L29A3" /LENGTH=236 /DNA_ID=CAMNT_0039023293 /DNA_START=177 /DNA_END=887 /DNA_ORIENTATION=+